MSHFFERRDRWGNGLALWVILGAIFITPLCAWSVRDTHIENNIEQWLPEDNPNAVTLKWSLQQFGMDAGDGMFVSWDGSSLNDPRVELLARKLEGVPDEQGIRRGGLPQIARVVTPQDVLRRMVDHGVDRDEALQSLHGVLIGTGPYKLRLTEYGRQRLKEVQREIVAKAKSEFRLTVQVLPPAQDFLANEDELSASTDVTEGVPQVEGAVPNPMDVEPLVFDPIAPHDFQIRWRGMSVGQAHVDFRKFVLALKGTPTADAPNGLPLVEDCFQSLGSPIALSVGLSEAGEAEKARSMELIRQAAVDVGISREQLHLGGRNVSSTALNEGVKSAAWNSSAPLSRPWARSIMGMSGLVGALVAFSMLRSLKLTLLVLFVSYFTVFVTVALVPLTGGSMNMVLVLMPTFLLVVVMSGAIHVAHYWRHAAYHTGPGAIVGASRMAAAPCFFATVTTAIGLLSLLTSDLKPVRDFGVFSAVGSFIGLVMVLYLLPSLIQLMPFQPPKLQEVDATRWENFGRWCADKRHWIVWSYTVASLLCLVGLKWFRTETKVIRYFPPESTVVQDYWFIEENIAGIVPVDVIVRFDRDSQTKMNFLERMDVVREVERKMRAHPEISGAIALPDFRPQLEKPAANAGILAKSKYHKTASETERRIKAGEVSGVKSFFAMAPKANDLRHPGDAALNAAGDELWRITAQCYLMSESNFGDLLPEVHAITQSVLRSHAGTRHVVTGMVPVFLQTQQALLDSQVSSFALSYLTVSIVMVFAVRNLLAGLMTMLPNAYPIGQIFGLISFCGIPVDIGTMMTASIAMGIGVDGTLHKLTWFRKGIADGKSRKDAIALAVGHSGPAIWETSAVLALGMLMLFPSDLLLISRFGWLMAAIIAVAVAGDIVFLPALLAGSMGTMIIHAMQNSGIANSTSATPKVVPAPHLPTAQMPASQTNER